eukprot:gene6796-9309_t
MSVVGIDFGNLSMLIGQAGKGGVDVILNDSSNRQTATAVSIQGKQRFIGDSGAAMARSNITNTISTVKLLVGRIFDDPDVQREISKAPFKAVKLPSGGVGVSVVYDNSTLVVTAEHFLAMLLVKAKEISFKANNGVNIGDAVLAVPHWFTESQRRGILNACEIASLNCLKITNESNAIALSYGIFKSAKQLFSVTDPVHIMFIDLGYTGYCVTIVDFIQENMKVLSTVCSREIGGRIFDDIIIEFMAEAFEKKTKINVRGNIKALLKLQAGAEKAKKTLSPAGVNEANISVECLADDHDLNVILTREEFESRAASAVALLEGPILQALNEANLTKEQIHEIEIVGGSSRVNLVKKRLGEVLGLDPTALNYGLKTTMNADEAVARGCALQCAMLSSRMKVKPFNITDKIPYGYVAHFEAGGTEGDVNSVSQTTAALYTRGDELPHKPRRLTFKNKTKDFTIEVYYDDQSVSILPPGESRFVTKFTIKIPPAYANKNSDIRVTWNLDKNGFIYIQSAQLLEEIIPVPGEENPPVQPGGDSKEDGKDGDGSSNKKKFKKTDLEVSSSFGGLSTENVKQALELEASMAFEDKLIIETADKRNELESYIYTMRDKIDGPLKQFIKDEEKSKFKSILNESEDWLYNDGYEASKNQYARKIDDLRVVGNPIEARFNESNNRPIAIDGLKKQLDMCKSFAANYDEAHSHITEEERQSLRKEIQATEGWLYDSISKQSDLKDFVDPILTVEIINGKRNALFNVSNPIITKPKPKPAPTPAPPAPESKDAKDESKDGTPMEQSKGGPEEEKN